MELPVADTDIAPVPPTRFASVEVAWNGECAELPDMVSSDATDADIKAMVAEAVRAGFPGMRADQGVDLANFVLDRYAPTEARPIEKILVRAKTPFGGEEDARPTLTAAEKLSRLYNHARPQGMGFSHFTPEDMTVEQAQALLDARPDITYFDYLKGRVMKIDVAKEPLDTRLYNRDNGYEAAERALGLVGGDE